MIDEVHGLRPDLLETEKALLGIVRSDKRCSKKGVCARVSEPIWNYFLNSKQKEVTLDEIVKAIHIPRLKVSQKLYKLKSQGYLKFNDNATWSIGLK